MNPVEALYTTPLAHGFRRERSDLYSIWREGNLGLLTLTRGKYSTAEAVRISATIAVHSRRLADVFGPPVAIRYPEFNVEHWYRGAVYVSDREGIEQPWLVVASDPATLKRATDELVGFVIGALESRLTDEGLRDDWLMYEDPWQPEVVQVSYLYVLTRAIGPRDANARAKDRLEELLASRDAVPGLPIVADGLRMLRMR
jgi:hypothetical protein